MAGSQIALIAEGAALVAATIAVLADRALARRSMITRAGHPVTWSDIPAVTSDPRLWAPADQPADGGHARDLRFNCAITR